MKVLLLVDVQQDFCSGGSLAVEQADQIVPVINRLMAEGGYDLIIASKDWHPLHHVSFAAEHPGAKIFQKVRLADGSIQKLWPVHCVAHTAGAELHPDLDYARIHRYIHKGCDAGIDSYSAFFDNKHLHQTDLHETLLAAALGRGESLDDMELHVAGLALDVCVAHTILDARALGYRTSLILDATRAVSQDPAKERKLLRKLHAAQVEIIQSRAVCRAERVQDHRHELHVAM